MINPAWLRTFARLAEIGSFTRTAHQLDITQAAVSQHVRHLEQAYGQLLIRSSRRIELTPAGQALLDYCREVESADKRLAARLADRDATSGEISIITPGSVGLLLYPMLLRFQEINPGLFVRHRFAPDSEVLSAVLQNRFEIGLVTQKPDDPRLVAQPFAEEPLELVAPARARIKVWSDLVRLGFIDHPDGEAMAIRLLNRAFPDNNGIRNLPRHGFSNQIGLILEPVARGLGFTVIPRYARQAFARPDDIQVIAIAKPVIDTLWLIHRAEWPITERASRVIAHLRHGMAAAHDGIGQPNMPAPKDKSPRSAQRSSKIH